MLVIVIEPILSNATCEIYTILVLNCFQDFNAQGLNMCLIIKARQIRMNCPGQLQLERNSVVILEKRSGNHKQHGLITATKIL